MRNWKQNFVDKLNDVKGKWSRQFDQALDDSVMTVFDDMATFVRNHGIATSIPLRDEGRRSFKFELNENAYLLIIFRSAALGEFEFRREIVTPGSEPQFTKSNERLSDVSEKWTRTRFEAALDEFIDQLNRAEVQNLETVAA